MQKKETQLQNPMQGERGYAFVGRNRAVFHPNPKVEVKGIAKKNGKPGCKSNQKVKWGKMKTALVVKIPQKSKFLGGRELEDKLTQENGNLGRQLCGSMWGDQKLETSIAGNLSTFIQLCWEKVGEYWSEPASNQVGGGGSSEKGGQRSFLNVVQMLIYGLQKGKHCGTF